MAAEQGRSLAETPTWSVATVTTLMVAACFLVERSLSRFAKWLRKTKRKAMLAALEKIREVYNELCFLQCLYLPAQLHLAVEECLFGSFRLTTRSCGFLFRHMRGAQPNQQQSKDVIKALKKWIGHRNPKVQLLALSVWKAIVWQRARAEFHKRPEKHALCLMIYSSILKDSCICPLPESVVPFDVYGVEDFKIEDTNVHNPTTHKFQEDPKSDPRHCKLQHEYEITGLTNNSYFDGAHEVRHYLRKHSDLGCIVLEVAKVYVSTVQANNYPITCTQWHPEKAIFEWRKPMIPHSEDAIQALTSIIIQFKLAVLHVGLSICKKGPWFDETCKSGERKMEFMLT
ncbi:MLO-like protein 4 [Zea mays]|uniref:MLO-like protein 4 n=1 Tax=Zea mays TaxID=4577 RepID=A0A3L6F6C1_MAIZE|nr:MLO-like protein 4 [Zea mays]